MPLRSAFLVSLALMACASRSGTGPSDAQLSAARKAAPAGAKVFALYCSSCHGEHGDAPFAPAAMGKQALRRRAELENGLDLFRYLKTRMPPGDEAGSLSDEQYWAVTEYMLRAQERPLPEPFDATTAASVQLE